MHWQQICVSGMQGVELQQSSSIQKFGELGAILLLESPFVPFDDPPNL
jgi:hypothetical protein